MNRRHFLSGSLLAAPALLALSSLPSHAATTGTTLITTPNLSAGGVFDIQGIGSGGNGLLNMVFSSGPNVYSQFGPRAMERVINASAGDRFGVTYSGHNGAGMHQTEWTINQTSLAEARARFRVDGTLEAEASADLNSDPLQGAGLAAMVIAALSAGSIVRSSSATELQALVAVRNAPAGMAFGLEVTVNAV